MAEYIEREALLRLLEDDELYGYLSATDIINFPSADVSPMVPCPEDCIYRGVRHQKCSCCARNKYLKDCYRGRE